VARSPLAMSYARPRNLRMNAPDSIKILGVPVSVVDMDVVLTVIDGWVAGKRREYVCIRDVHGIMQARQDLAFKAIHDRAGMVTPDGMPLVWVSHLRGRLEARRVSGPDLMPALCAHSLDKGYRHYFYGGNQTVAERLVDRLTALFPGLQIAGWECPPLLPASDKVDEEVVRRINATRPDIVWVGLSSPKQEYWMAAHAGRIEAAALIGVGAAFDIHAGIKKRAPSSCPSSMPSYNNDHPLVVRARAELRDINNSIAAETGRIISNLKNEYDVAKAREDSMQKSLDHRAPAASIIA
jgi:N-acetylglucosaminyldiphosphoundecaprenol N-acetyl-beta-D-mannosaminyltransferase